jgi:hypothetical protein
MSVVTSGSWQKSLWPGIDSWFNEAYDEHEEEFSQIFSRRNSGKQFEQAVGMSLLGLAPVKDEGDPIQYDDTQQTYINQYDHAVRALGTIITLEAYRDNQYNLDALSERPRALAFSMRQTQEHDGANILNRAFNSSYTMGTNSDGVELCDSAHPNGPYGATASNIGTAADLAETTLEDQLVSIMQATDPRGLKIGVMPQCLVIPPALNFVAARILESALQNDTANNAVNVLRAHNSLPDGYKVNHYLTDTDAWFVTTSISKQGKGLVCYDAWPLEFGMDNEFDTFNMKVKAFLRYSFGWDDWRGIWGNAGA